MVQTASLFAAAQLPLAPRLFKLETADDIERLIASIPNGRWQPLGGRENNFPVVNIGADPADGLVERVTNAMDALIERAIAKQGDTLGFTSPRSAAERLFGIPYGRLANLSDTRRRAELAQALRVTARDSGEPRRPTIVVEDCGIGQHPDDFPKTLLSLNESNKVTRPELIGAFGQGGSSVFAFSRYAAFIARRDPSLRAAGQDDCVGWTIVRFNPLDENYKHGRYEYLVVADGAGRFSVPRFAPTELPDEYADFVGCHFVAIGYQLERYSDPVFHARASLWHLLNAALFDPIYPILIRDERPKALKEDQKRATQGIVVNGNATRLAEDKRDKIDYSSNYAIQLDGDGTAMLRYSVLKDAGDNKRDWEIMANYVAAEQAVTITVNGQRQGTYRRDIFDKLGLLSIGKALIVHVDCDGLSKQGKWRLFSTTRDRVKESEIAKKLEDGIREGLRSDQELRARDRERKAKALARQSATEAKKIEEWLRSAINNIKQGTQEVYRKVVSTNPEYQLLGDHPLLDETVDSPNGTLDTALDPPLTEAPEVPTDLYVLNPTVKVPIGGAGVVRLAMNAPDDYISNDPGAGPGMFTARFSKGTTLFRMTGYSAVRRGVVRATIAAAEGIPPGEYGRVIFAVTRPDTLPLLAEADVVAVEPPRPRAKPAGAKPGPEPGPNVKPVDREGWIELGLSEQVVARVEEGSTDTTIYVYKEYPKLMSRLQRERVAEELLIDYQSKFVAAMALAAWLQHEDQKASETVIEQEANDMEIRRAAEVFMLAQSMTKDRLGQE